MTVHDAELARRFSGLGRTGKAEFLSRVAHGQTIRARESYAEQYDDAAALAVSNELVHRLVGYIVQVLTRDTEADQDASVIQMIIEFANYDPGRYSLWLDEAARS